MAESLGRTEEWRGAYDARWTAVWVDCETDGFHGRLLPIALVTASGANFYGALPAMHASADAMRLRNADLQD